MALSDVAWIRPSVLVRFALGIVCFVSATLLSAWTDHLFRTANEWVKHTYQVLDLIADVKASVSRVEANSRAYAISGKDWYLQEVPSVEGSVLVNLNALQALTKDNAQQQLKLSDLKPLLEEKFSNLRYDVELRRTNQGELVAPWIGVPKRLQLTQQIFGILDSMRSQERRLLAGREAASRRVSEREIWLSAASALLAIALIVSSYRSLADTVSARNEATRKLEARTRELEKAQSRAHVASWHWDSGRSWIEWSPELYRIAGRDESLPPPTFAEHPALYTTSSWIKLQSLIRSALVEKMPFTYEVEMTRPDGTRRWVAGEAEPEFDSEHAVTGLSGTLQDVTESRRLNAELKDLAFELEEAQRQAQVGSLRVNFETGQTLYSPEFYRILRRDPDSTVTLEGLHVMCFPATWKRVQEELSVLLKEGTPVTIEHELLHPDGEMRWLVGRAEALRNEAGEIIGFRGTYQDVTDRHALEEELRRKNSELEESQRLAEVGNWSYNPATEEVKWSRQMYLIHGWPLHLPPPSLAESARFFNPETYARIDTFVDAVMRGGNPGQIEHELIQANGARRWVVSHCEMHGDAGSKSREVRGSTVDLTERKIAEEAVNEAKERAEAANRTKADFLASMSHEIRTPMNGVIGMTSLLMTTALSSEQQSYVETIRGSGESLLTLIDDILDFSKIEAGKIRLEELALDLYQVAEDAVDVISPIAAGKNVKLLYDPGVGRSGVCYGDPHRVRQVILNLLSNAVKFTSQGTVTLSLGEEKDALGRGFAVMRVTDTGIGISDSAMAGLFQKFTQADSSTTRRFGGAGMGLAISRGLAMLMGGEIGGQSEPGVGSTFWFRLPLRKAASNGDLPVPDKLKGRVLIIADDPTDRSLTEKVCLSLGLEVSNSDEGVLTSAFIDCDQDKGACFQRAEQLRSRPGNENLRLICLETKMEEGARERVAEFGNACYLTKPLLRKSVANALKDTTVAGPNLQANRNGVPLLTGHILVAEDNKTNQILMVHLLRRLGCSSEIVPDGLEVVKAAQNGHYDLILMDCQMPNMDGWQATEIIRRSAGAVSKLPIIAVTAGAFSEDRAKCLAAGMNDYLAKPVDLPTLRRALSQWLAERTETPDLANSYADSL